MKHIGMDLGGSTTTVTVLSARGKRMLDRTVRTSEADLVELICQISGNKRVVVEESRLADWICRALAPHVTEVVRCQPQHNALISRSENKCDEEDRFALARLSYLGELKPVHHTAWAYRQLREVVRGYWKSSWDLTAAKNRLKSYFLFNGIACSGERVYLPRWREAFAEKLRARSANLKLARLHYQRLDVCRELKSEHIRMLRQVGQPFGEGIGCLKSMPGVGVIGAHTLVAYLEDGSRFSNKRQVWKYCRLSVRKHLSQGKGRRGSSRQGNRYVKAALMATVASLSAWPKENNALSQLFYEGLARGVEPAPMRRNLARKVVVVAHHLLRRKRKYRDELIILAG
jgi:transposase